jgi:hypothetical protein
MEQSEDWETGYDYLDMSLIEEEEEQKEKLERLDRKEKSESHSGIFTEKT